MFRNTKFPVIFNALLECREYNIDASSSFFAVALRKDFIGCPVGEQRGILLASQTLIEIRKTGGIYLDLKKRVGRKRNISYLCK